MRILAACEESQEACKAFRLRGHEAYSCDIMPCSGGKDSCHIQDDVENIINHYWDLIIAFPPCTDLSCACANIWPEKKKDGRQQKAFNFVLKIWNAPCKKVCIENPQGWLNTNWKKPTQTIHPYYFGDPWMKRTCLWIRGLPQLRYQLKDNMWNKKTSINPIGYWTNSSNRKNSQFKNGKYRDPIKRSKTFPAIAKAMADQWG